MTVEKFMIFAISLNIVASGLNGYSNKMGKAYYHLGVALLLAILQWGCK